MQAYVCPCDPLCTGIGDPIHGEQRWRDVAAVEALPMEMLDPRTDVLNVVRDVLDHINLHHNVAANQSNRYDAAIAALEEREYDLAYGSGHVPFEILDQPVFWMQLAAAFSALADVLEDSQLEFAGEPHPAVVAIVQDVDDMAELMLLNQGFPEASSRDASATGLPIERTTTMTTMIPQRPGLSVLQGGEANLRITSLIPVTGTTTTIGSGTEFIDHFDARHLRIDGLENIKILHPLQRQDVADLQTYFLRRSAVRLTEGLSLGKYGLVGDIPCTAVSASLQAIAGELQRRGEAMPGSISRDCSQPVASRVPGERCLSLRPTSSGSRRRSGLRTPSFASMTPGYGLGRGTKMPPFGSGTHGLTTPGFSGRSRARTPLSDPLTSGFDLGRGIKMHSFDYGTLGLETPGHGHDPFSRTPSLSEFTTRTAAGRQASGDGVMTSFDDYGPPTPLQRRLSFEPRGRAGTPGLRPRLSDARLSYTGRRPSSRAPGQLRQSYYGPRRTPGHPYTSQATSSLVSPVTPGRRTANYQALRNPQPCVGPSGRPHDFTRDLEELGSGKAYTEWIRLGRTTEFNVNHPLTAADLDSVTGEDFVQKLAEQLELTNSRLTTRDLQDGEMAKRYHARNQSSSALQAWFAAHRIEKEASAEKASTSRQTTPEGRETVAECRERRVSENGPLEDSSETQKIADRIMTGQVDDLLAEQGRESSASSGLAVAGRSDDGKGKRSVSFHEAEKSRPPDPRRRPGSATGDRTSVLRGSLPPAWSTPRSGSASRPFLSPRASSDYRSTSFRNADRVRWLETQQRARQERVSNLTEKAAESTQAKSGGDLSQTATTGPPSQIEDRKQTTSADETETPGEAPSDVTGVATADDSDVADLSEFRW